MAQVPSVVLPCDLPYWKVIHEHLVKLQSGEPLFAQNVAQRMIEIYNIANVSVEEKETRTSNLNAFLSFERIVDQQFSSLERERFLTKTLPCMARYALALEQLKPSQAFQLSLQGLNHEVKLDRRFVASLVANMFFSTFPARSSKMLPNLPDSSFTTFFHSILESLPQAFMLKNLLNYFDILDEEQPCGHLVFVRSCPMVQKSELFQSFMARDRRLAPIYVLPEPKPFDIQANFSILTLKHLCWENPSHFLDLIWHPELLVTRLFMEELQSNESLSVTGLLSAKKEPTTTGNGASTSKYFITSHEDRSNEPTRTVLERYLWSIPDESNPSNLEQTESSDVSSKSGLLDDLADDLSMNIESAQKSDTQKSMLTECSTSEERNPQDPKAASKSTSKFSERFRAALARGNTPDSEVCGQPNARSQSSFRVQTKSTRNLGSRRGSGGFLLDHDDKDGGCEDAFVLHRRKLFKQNEHHVSSWSGGSSYSFEGCEGLEGIDVEYEEILASLDPRTLEQDKTVLESKERIRAFQNLAKATHKRTFSESWEALSHHLERKGVDDSVKVSSLWTPINSYALKRWQSFCLDESLLANPRSIPSVSNIKNKMEKEPNNSYILVHDASQEFSPENFIMRWLAVSLAGYPLMVYQSDKRHDLGHIFEICQKMDEMKWSTKDLSLVVSAFFKTEPLPNSNETSSTLVTMLEQSLQALSR
ncbi:hypothetical protein TCAL_03228 [Tigriopus californicus]|uniref:PARG helical domain-containing protein n=1 Tax=Tigriopus californicus TaxID=6832 RepID=A0A553NT69_TIGCA|nr:hypothetical protein TCAL_03228 [Tigriopus californicus]|eukprot:TCALIF_03228-PA protein Name:"Similar to PARG Poly(ADP-ribose) glycohydrolase (Bos taurus)" AED:0.42 eAED:0.42 QI:0/-1/0/1/-1/1/1/0/704